MARVSSSSSCAFSSPKGCARSSKKLSLLSISNTSIIDQFSNNYCLALYFNSTHLFIKTIYHNKTNSNYYMDPIERTPYMHQWEIKDADQLPLPDQKRKITDVCCIMIGVLFGLLLLILAIVLYNEDHLNRTQYPVDYKGTVCVLEAEDKAGKYPFLYFNDIENPSKRYCVQDCPQIGVSANCFNNCTISYYNNYPTSSKLGPICVPTDTAAKNRLFYNSGLYQQYNNVKAIQYLLLGVAISFGLSLLWIFILHCLPRFAVWASIILTAILLFIAALICFTSSRNHLYDLGGWAIFLGIVCIVLMLLIAFYSFFHRKQVQLCASFLKIAGSLISENCSIILIVLLFIFLTFAYGILIVFEYLAFSSSSQPTFSPNFVFLQNNRNEFLIFLLVIQIIWGLSFFRDAFNYIISGVASDKYFHKQFTLARPFSRLFCKNIGSVIGGSLLSGLFYIPSLIISFLFSQVDCCCCNLFDLMRSDIYSYIYLTGNSYCPSSRQAQYLCNRSRFTRENQSMLAIYAFTCRLLMALAAILIIYWITKDNLVEERVAPILLLGIFFMCLYITCYFVDLYTVFAESLMICFLTEEDLNQDWTCQNMKYCPQDLRNIINDIEFKKNILSK